jgi:hypothetical protein
MFENLSISSVKYTTILRHTTGITRPPEAPPYVCPEKSPKSALKSAII